MEIGGSLLASFLVCQRQAWLSYHSIEGDHDNDFLREGTYIHNEAYKRHKNNQTIGGSNIDTTQTKEGKLIIGEVKKSSHCIEAARMQLAFTFITTMSITQGAIILGNITILAT